MKQSVTVRLFFLILFPLLITTHAIGEEKKSNADLLRETTKALTFNELFERANTLAGSDPTQAASFYRQALAINRNYPQVHYNLGICLSHLGNDDQALASFNDALRLQASYAKAHLQRGIILKKQQKPFEALEALTHAVHHDKDSWDAYLQLGLAYRDISQFDDAIKNMQKSIALNPTNINALFELATTYHMIDNSPACLSLYKKVLTISPNNLSALYNYGFTLKKMGDIEQALAIYDRVIKKDPNYAQAHFSRSLAYLTLGDFEKGWAEYEWRWKSYNETPNKYNSPLWDGSNPAGKTVLIYAEQGLGDTFQFIRYGQLLKQDGARVIALVQRPLKAIITLCPYLDTVITADDPVPAHDAHIALMSLPLLYKTRVDTVPDTIPYLHADEKLTTHWQQELAHDSSFKIGICWQGNANYRTQFLRQAVAAKSMQLQDFMPLAAIPGVRLYSIQKITGTDQVHIIDQQVHLFDESFDREHGRFMDTAAVIHNLDLVITIDTSIAHLAAGLGTPTWVLLPYPADWRWLLNTNDTPWYPNMRLFRQTTVGDWQTPMYTITTLLTPLVALSQQVRSGNAINVADILDAYTLLQPRTIPTVLLTQKKNICYENSALAQALIAELVTINTDIWKLEQMLHQKPQSLFDNSFIQLAQKAYESATRKLHIKAQLNTLNNQIKS